jgi:photosystem II stability/assembly factor-like uncharacterized protein
MIYSHSSIRASHFPKSPEHTSNLLFVTAKKMKRPVVEKTIRLLIAIAFSITVALAQSRGFTIQVESALSEAEARSSVGKLRAQGLEAYFTKTTIAGMGIRYRVRIGRYQSQAQAKAKADQLLSAGAIKEFIVTGYDPPPSDPAAPDKSINKSESRKGKNIPEAEIESGPGATRPRKTTNAGPAEATPATAEAPVDMTINDDDWKVVKRGAEMDKNLRAVYFVDATTGWAAGEAGAVYQTTDGGKDWRPLSSAGAADISFIYFIDWNRGWMLGKPDGKAPGEAESGNILFITANGGRTWTRKPLPYVTKLYFIDAKTGWAVGRNSTLLKTTDGGMEWSKVGGVEKLLRSSIESSTYDFGFSDIRFTDAKHGWLIGNFYGQARGDIGGVFTTSDGGDTWKRVPLTIQTRQNSGRFTPGSLHSAHFTDAKTGSITGEMYDGESRFFFALHTRDGGLSWSLFRIPSRFTHNSQFLDPARGWTAAFAPRAGGDEAAVCDTTLLRTDNGGLSWRIDFIARGRRIRGIFFLSPTKGWAVGDRGMILAYEEKSKTH